jgi:hypothetical protein
MIDDDLELESQNEALTRHKSRMTALAARAMATGVTQLAVDMRLATARIENLEREIAQLRRARSGTIGMNASRSLLIQQLKSSVQEMELRLCGLESLLIEYVRRQGR